MTLEQPFSRYDGDNGEILSSNIDAGLVSDNNVLKNGYLKEWVELDNPPVSYTEYSWNGEALETTEKTSSRYTVVTPVLFRANPDGLKSGDYVVRENTTIEDYFYIRKGCTVNLIVPAGKTLTCKQGIGCGYDRNGEYATLNIFGEGKIVANGKDYAAGIGGSEAGVQNVINGQKAARPEDPTRIGFIFKDWYQVTDTGSLEDTGFDFENTTINEDITLRAVWEEITEETVIIKSANVEFQGQIQLKFTLNFPESVLADEVAYVSFAKAGTVTTKLVSEGSKRGNDVEFIIPVPAPEYADDIIIKVFSGDGGQLVLRSSSGTDYTANGFAYSVRTYAEKKSRNGSTQKMRDLAKALNDYGTAAQIYFRYGDFSGASVDSAVTAVTLDDLAPYVLTTEGTRPGGVTGAGIRVGFESDNTLRITFKTDGSRPLNEYTFLLDDKETKPVKSGKNAYLQVENIAAPNLDTLHTFTVTDGTDTYTVTACALSYAYTSVKNGDGARQDLGKALYLYNRAADAYFDS